MKAYNFIDLTGRKFSKWTVVEYQYKIEPSGNRRLKWFCRCDCGNTRLILGHALTTGSTVMCKKCSGCLYEGEKNHTYRHGMSKTNIYKIWVGILSRCNNPKVRIYRYYGGRGISVCEKWTKFENFYSDMGDRPKGHQIDRMNNDKGYSPGNCRWVLPVDNNPYNKGDILDTMPGKTFGKWHVVKRVKHKPNHWYYLCRCECGTEKIIPGGSLRRGETNRCVKCRLKKSDV